VPEVLFEEFAGLCLRGRGEWVQHVLGGGETPAQGGGDLHSI